MKKTMRWFSILLAICMVLNVGIVTGLAAEATDTFSDVPDDASYKEALDYVYANGLMNGVGGGAFNPNGPLTRAMFVTILHRLAGEPEPEEIHSFDDVPEDAWYAKAVSWAFEQGIAKGYGNGKFGPNDSVSREQLAVFMFRYGTKMGYNMTARAPMDDFPDAESMTPEMQEAMSWAVASGVFAGDEGDALNPKAPAKRHEAATTVTSLDLWTETEEAKPVPTDPTTAEPTPAEPTPAEPTPTEPEDEEPGFVPTKPLPSELQYPVILSEDGTTVTYGYENEEQVITLDAKNIFLDGRLTEEEAAEFPYVYTTFNEAVTHLTAGTEDEPMNLWIAPYVYWIHDPNSPETTKLTELSFGVANLHITGLTHDPKNVVIAGNYGHDEGYNGGNPTMFGVSGNGLQLRNVTFGNYCNIDLEYPLDPSLNVPKRTTNVTQGQIASYSGDKLYAENCRFVSRLNMMPFNNSRRALYVNCHLESTADSLNGSAQAVYLHCDFEFHSGKAWGGSSGVTLLDCDMTICHQYTSQDVTELTHYMVKMRGGRFNVIDGRLHSNYPKAQVNIGWCDVIDSTYRSYIANVTHNGQPEFFTDGGAAPLGVTVDLTDTDGLKAYKIVTDDGETVYNVYNLLRGNDGWDPLGQKEIIEAAGAQDVPTGMSLRNAGKSTLETGTTDTATLSYSLSGPQSTNYTNNAEVTWSVVDPAHADLVVLNPSEDGKTCTVTGANETEEAVVVTVKGKDKTGLEAAVALTVRPSILEAPAMTDAPVITQNADGTASVSYTLDLGERADMSRIVWSICDDDTGANAIEIASGRGNEPLKTIPVYSSYTGKVLRAVISPKHIRSDYGSAVTVYSAPLTADKMAPLPTTLNFNISAFPTAYQNKLLPGFWAVDQNKPSDISDPTSSFKANWNPGTGTGIGYATGSKDGVKDYSGIYFTTRGARLRFVPEGDAYGDMSFTMKVAPGKTASQGFGSANQYMDVLIKFDAETNVGYGLRIYRFQGNSCKFALVEYKSDGSIALITDSVVSQHFLTECTITVTLEGNKLKAHVESSGITVDPNAMTEFGNITLPVDLETEVSPNLFGGICIQHTGTVGDNTVYIGFMEVAWQPLALQ